MSKVELRFLLGDKLVLLLSLCREKGVEIDHESIQECIKELRAN